MERCLLYISLFFNHLSIILVSLTLRFNIYSTSRNSSRVKWTKRLLFSALHIKYPTEHSQFRTSMTFCILEMLRKHHYDTTSRDDVFWHNFCYPSTRMMYLLCSTNLYYYGLRCLTLICHLLFHHLKSVEHCIILWEVKFWLTGGTMISSIDFYSSSCAIRILVIHIIGDEKYFDYLKMAEN